jgi:hypothetical protein
MRRRQVGTAGMGRHYGKMRARAAVPGISRDLCDRYRQEREKERDHPSHTCPARSVILLPGNIGISARSESSRSAAAPPIPSHFPVKPETLHCGKVGKAPARFDPRARINAVAATPEALHKSKATHFCRPDFSPANRYGSRCLDFAPIGIRKNNPCQA